MSLLPWLMAKLPFRRPPFSTGHDIAVIGWAKIFLWWWAQTLSWSNAPVNHFYGATRTAAAKNRFFLLGWCFFGGTDVNCLVADWGAAWHVLVELDFARALLYSGRVFGKAVGRTGVFAALAPNALPSTLVGQVRSRDWRRGF